MFATGLENLLKTVTANQITEFFLWALVIIFMLSLYWKRNDRHGAFTNYTPTLLTSLGILGTFGGIITGLLDFDPQDLDGSIGLLLEGLKTAFITSLVGMALSILYKGISASGVLAKKQQESVDEGQLGIGDLYLVMRAQANGIEEIKNSISRDDESSLVGQIKLLRSDLSDNHKAINQHMLHMAQTVTRMREIVEEEQGKFQQFQEKLWIKLQDFADMMSKSATEQVIEALKQVIQDFNQNLVEQFGDNFKQLNEAVFRLLEWQDNYKEQLAEMKHNYDLGVQAITDTESSVARISSEAKVIPETMNDLKEVMEINQHQISELNNHLEAFKEIRDRAVMAVPEIRDQIDQAIEGAVAANDVLAKGMQQSADRMSEILIEGSDQFKDSVGQANAALVEASQATANTSQEIRDQFEDALKDINENMRNLIGELQDGSQELNKGFQQASEDMIGEIKEISNNLGKTIEEQATEHRQQADRIFAGLQGSIQDALSNTGESVEKQIAMIDQVLGDELEKVMNSMGSALASISGQFTEDYSRLVRQMQQVTTAHQVEDRGH